MTTTHASPLEIIGGLSKTTKMPGYSYSFPAAECRNGSKLHAVPGSVCEKCYARRGNYAFGNVQSVLYRRLESIQDPRWEDAMVASLEFLVNPLDPAFRWLDSGDLPNYEFLRRLVRVVERTPWIRHWLPTKEYGLIRRWLAEHGPFPENLVVRPCSPMVDGKPLTHFEHSSIVVSFASGEADLEQAGVHLCPADQQGHKCGACRACWDPAVKVVAYAFRKAGGKKAVTKEAPARKRIPIAVAAEVPA